MCPKNRGVALLLFVAKTIAALKLSRVSVAGASYGSATALTVAARHPELVDRVARIEGGAPIVPETLNYSSMYVFFKWPFFGDIRTGCNKPSRRSLPCQRSS